jgi:hypothetical protein
MKYFPLILFIPAAIAVLAAIVTTKDRQTKLTLSNAVLVFIVVVVILTPTSILLDFLIWMKHALFHSH